MIEKSRKKNSAIEPSFLPFESGRRFHLAHLLLALLIIIILTGGIYFASRSGSDPQIYTNDFNVYYYAARQVIAGRDPYQDSLRPSTPYLYPPLLSEAIIPLALLPLPLAAYLWYLASAASILSAAWMAAWLGWRVIQSKQAGPREAGIKLTPGDSIRMRIIIACGSLFILIRFILDNFDFGQVNTIVAALAVAHVYFYVRQKKTLSAFALVLAASIKLTPIILILYHLARLRFKFIAECLCLLVIISLLSFLPFGSRGPDALMTFVNRTVRNGQGFDLAFSGNQSIRGAVARLAETEKQKPDMYGGQSTRRPTSALTLIISIAIVALAILSAFKASSDLSASAPFFCCFVLLSPLSWKAHFVVLILPIAYLIAGALAATEKRRSYLIAVLVALFALFNITSPKVFGPEWGEWTDAHSLVCAGALLSFSVAVWQATRRFVNLN